jgi:uncharacterized protein YhaN
MISLIICLALPGVALAGRAADLMAQIDIKNTELGQALKEEDRLTSENENDFKAYKAYSDSHAQLDKQARAIVDAFKANTERQSTYRNGLVENWNAQCAKDRVGSLPEAQYNACLSSGAEVDRVVAGIDADMERQRAQAQRDLQPLVDAGTRQENEMAAIDARMKARFASWQKFKDAENRIRSEVNVLYQELQRQCALQETIEDVRYCASLGFDGTSRTLPPLTKIRPSFSATPNN